MTKYVYDFSEGGKDQKDLLGGKGANLAEMTNLGLPVPPGFTITTDACRAYLEQRRRARRARRRGRASTSRRSRRQMGRTLGEPDDPLLVSVRSGAKFSMPGMMETVLNVGLNDESVHGPRGDDRRRRAVRLRLLPPAAADVRQHRARHRGGRVRATRSTGSRRPGAPRTTSTSTSTTCAALVATYKELIEERTGRDFPQDPREQLDLAVRAVFDSWNTERAVLYRRQERIPDDLGTAVNICSMVFGNGGDGLRHRRRVHPRPGLRRAGRLRRLPAERAGRGRRRRHPQHRPARRPRAARQERRTTSCSAIMATLEEHYRDLCDIEFTIERGKLWMLQTRVGKRTAEAAFRIACQLVDQGLIDMDEARAPGHRRPARAADVPALRRRRPTAS